jgi:site-specific recombinase XerD
LLHLIRGLEAYPFSKLVETLYSNRRQPRYSGVQLADKDYHQQKAPIPGHHFHSPPWLTEKGILAMNPAREVKREEFSRREGKIETFDTEQVQKVLDKIDTSTEVGLRDRALLGTLAYTFARIGAVVNLKVEDYFQTGKRSLILFREKGGKETEIPVHHKLEELLDEY